MKKPILFAFMFISLLAVGCSMNTKNPNSDKVIEQTSNNMNKLMNARFKDVEKSFGNPYSSVYYIDTREFKGKDIQNITMDDIRDNISILSTYKNNKKSDEYIHVYYENGIVKEALAGKYDLNKSSQFNKKDFSNAEYKVEFFRGEGVICQNDFSLSYAKQSLLGKQISDFENAYYVKSANFIGSTMNGNDKIYFYPLVPHNVYPSKENKHTTYSSNADDKLNTVNPNNNNISTTNNTDNKDLGEYSKSAVLVYTKDNKIQSIEIIDNNFIMGLMDKTFTK